LSESLPRRPKYAPTPAPTSTTITATTIPTMSPVRRRGGGGDCQPGLYPTFGGNGGGGGTNPKDGGGGGTWPAAPGVASAGGAEATGAFTWVVAAGGPTVEAFATRGAGAPHSLQKTDPSSIVSPQLEQNIASPPHRGLGPLSVVRGQA
jgi:hypothetical protein